MRGAEASRAARCWGRLALVGFRETRHGHDFTANLLHIEADTLCPRCLSWIAPDQVVRRTAYGLFQHEACPLVLDAPDPARVH
jgi:hypothetical protein